MAVTKTERELVNLENKYWQALKDQDVDAALALTDDPCVVTGPQGVGRVDHEAYRKMMSGANWRIIDFKIGDDIEVRMLARNAAVVAYSVHEELTLDGERVTLDAADTSTWIKRDGRWVCSLHSESIIGDPFGRDRTTG
jgi:ketosteroid isomerase-like protein